MVSLEKSHKAKEMLTALDFPLPQIMNKVSWFAIQTISSI